MTLNEKIYALRTKQNLSQGDLADLLDVSRQSVSKWETGTSVPDLDKLIKLSEVFHVTLDELVLDRVSIKTFATGETIETAETLATTETFSTTEFSDEDSDDSDCPGDGQAAFSSASPSRSNDFIPRKAIGISLFWMAFISLLPGLTTGNYASMVVSVPFALCSVICLTCKRHTGLWCMWALFLPTDILLRFLAGTSMYYLFAPLFTGEIFNLRMIFSALLFLAAAVLVVITALRLYRKEMLPDRPALALLLGGWSLLILCALLPVLLHRYLPASHSPFYFVGVLVSEAEIILAAVLLTFTFRYLYNRKRC